jgi:PEGA domain
VTHSRSISCSRFPVVLASLALGCAAMVRGTHQDVPFSSSPPGAVVQASSASCETPCTLSLKRSKTQMLTVSKPGYQDGHVQLNSVLNGGWLTADILSWFPFNFFFMSADYDLEPATVNVMLQPLSTSDLSVPLKPLVVELRVLHSGDGYASVEVRERRVD